MLRGFGFRGLGAQTFGVQGVYRPHALGSNGTPTKRPSSLQQPQLKAYG